MGTLDKHSAMLEAHLGEAWFDLFRADTPGQAEAHLRQHEKTVLVVLELNDSLSDQQALDLVADYRRHVAWSRIPACMRG